MAKQRLCDTHAAEDEIFPRGFYRFGGAIKAYQQNRGESGCLHCNPEHAHVVGGKRQQHGKKKPLVHGVVQAHPLRSGTSAFHFVLHVWAREDGRSQSYERSQRDQVDIKGVDVEQFAR